MKHAAAYLTTALVFLALDAMWLGYVARSFYREGLGSMLADPFNIPAAIGFYALYMVGLAVFVLHPALLAGSAGQALVMGLLFGLVAYATYDLTNLATLKGFPVHVALVDMAWGAIATAAASACGVWLAMRIWS